MSASSSSSLNKGVRDDVVTTVEADGVVWGCEEGMAIFRKRPHDPALRLQDQFAGPHKRLCAGPTLAFHADDDHGVGVLPTRRQAGERICKVREAMNSRVSAAYAAMCGAAACAFRASRLAHFSMTTKVSGPQGV